MSQRLLLLSGGLDSTALAYWLQPELTLTIDYGQRSAEGEIVASSAIAESLGLEHAVVRANCADVGSGLLSGRTAHSLAPCPEWWPFRNQLLVTLAAAWGLARNAECLLVGSVAGDDQHVDGSPSFYAQLDRLLIMQEGQLRVEAPAITMTSAELIERSGIDGSVLGWTHSCYQASVACGQCPGCGKRQRVLAELGRLQ